MTIRTLSFRALVPALFLISLFGFPLNQNALYAQRAGDKPIRTIPANTPKPEWASTPGFSMDGSNLYFVGVSGRVATEQGARTNAQEQGRFGMAQYLDTSLFTEMRNASATYGFEADVANALMATIRRSGSISRAVVSQLKDRNYYTEVFKNGTREAFIVYVRMEISKDAADQMLERILEAQERALQQKTNPNQQDKDAMKLIDNLDTGFTSPSAGTT